MIAKPMPQYLVWILPRWRDPLFLPRCLVVLGAASVSIVLSIWLHQAVLGWLALVFCVWPYRHSVSVDRDGLHVRWLIFRARISAENLVSAEPSKRRYGLPVLTVRRREAPQIVLQGSSATVEALHATLRGVLLAAQDR